MQSLANKENGDLYFSNGTLGLGIAASVPPAALWTPAAVTTSLWYDAADTTTITLNGPTVSQWNDKSGGAKHATQGTAGSQPTYLTADQNGLNVLSFDGGDTLDHTYANSVTNISILIVISLNSQSGFRGVFSTNGQSSTTQTMVLGRQSSSANWGTYATNERPSNSNIQGTGWQLIELIRTTSGEFYRNGAADGTFAAAEGQNGHIGGNASFSQQMNGKLAEIIVYNTNISTANRQLNEGYLAHKWGIQASLPSDHPYKSAPPIAS